MDVNSAGTRLVVVGDFKDADGALHDQIVLIDLGATSTAVDPSWNTAAFTATCSAKAFDTYVRDVSFSPDGSYFVVADTGGGGSKALKPTGPAHCATARAAGRPPPPAPTCNRPGSATPATTRSSR